MSDEQPPPPAGPPGQAKSEGVAPGPPTPLPTPPPPGSITAQPMPSVPPIPLASPSTKPQTKSSADPAPAEPKDSFRELLETIVFVVVLVLMLKTFLAEAFVIPTGSMADTLLGYHHKMTCEKCGRPYLVNASSEADPQNGPRVDVVSSRCENCNFPLNDPRKGGRR